MAGCSYLEEILNKHHHQEPFYLPRNISQIVKNWEITFVCVLCLLYRRF